MLQLLNNETDSQDVLFLCSCEIIIAWVLDKSIRNNFNKFKHLRNKLNQDKKVTHWGEWTERRHLWMINQNMERENRTSKIQTDMMLTLQLFQCLSRFHEKEPNKDLAENKKKAATKIIIQGFKSLICISSIGLNSILFTQPNITKKTCLPGLQFKQVVSYLVTQKCPTPE